jgi:hypothetical protein
MGVTSTRVERDRQHEAGRIRQRHERARNGHPAVFEWLAKVFEHVLVELGEFVEEKNPVMGERHLARPRVRAAAHETGVGYGVVRGAEGPRREERRRCVEKPCHRMDLGGFERFIERQIGQNSREPSGQHGLTLYWRNRPIHQCQKKKNRQEYSCHRNLPLRTKINFPYL